MKKSTITKFADAHKKSAWGNPKVNYDDYCNMIYAILEDPEIKERAPSVHAALESFFDEKKYADAAQRTLMFQAAVDYVLSVAGK